MAFLERVGFIETTEEERERLARAPEGSINHYLSTLPVTIPEWPEDLLIQLPWAEPRTDRAYRVVVVPFAFRKRAGSDEPTVRRRLDLCGREFRPSELPGRRLEDRRQRGRAGPRPQIDLAVE